MQNKVISFFVVTLAYAASALAEPQITVTSGLPMADEVNPETQTAFSKIVSREQFETKTGSVADVLKQETGVQLRQSGGLGSYSSISLRGSDSQQVNVYLDGMLVNSAVGGGVDLSQFLLGGISEIEIYPDVTPIQLGFPNIGGAVNIKTLKTDDKVGRIYFGEGSFSARNIGGAYSNKNGAHSVLLVTEYLKAENDFEFLDNRQTPLNPYDDRKTKRTNDQFDQANLLLKYEYALSQDTGVQWLVANNVKDVHLPDVMNSRDNNANLDTRNTQTQVRVYRGFENDLSWSARAYYSVTDENYDDRQSKIGLGANWSKSVTTTYGINPSLAMRMESNVLTASMEIKSDRYDQDNLQRDALSPSWDRFGVNLGLQDEWQNSDGSWLLVPAISTVWLKNRGNVSESFSQQLQQSDTDHYESARMGGKRIFNQYWLAKSNIARNVRVPSLYELMGDRGFFVGNPDLQPETSIAVDGGVEYNSVALNGSFVVFHRDVKNAILSVFDSRGVGRYENNSAVEITGAELSLDHSITHGLGVFLRTTVQDPVNKSNLADRKNMQVPGLYSDATSTGVRYAYGRLENRLEYTLERGGYYGPGHTDAIPDKRVVNYSLNLHQASYLVSLDANNLLGQQYQDFNRFPAPGRNYFLRVTKDF